MYEICLAFQFVAGQINPAFSRNWKPPALAAAELTKQGRCLSMAGVLSDRVVQGKALKGYGAASAPGFVRLREILAEVSAAAFLAFERCLSDKACCKRAVGDREIAICRTLYLN